jgi:hypothetical protein
MKIYVYDFNAGIWEKDTRTVAGAPTIAVWDTSALNIGSNNNAAGLQILGKMADVFLANYARQPWEVYNTALAVADPARGLKP